MGKKVIKSLQDLELPEAEVGMNEPTDIVGKVLDELDTYESHEQLEAVHQAVVEDLKNEPVDFDTQIVGFENEVVESNTDTIEFPSNTPELEPVETPLVIDIPETGIDPEIMEELKEDEFDPMNRGSILQELTSLYATLKIPYVMKTWENMETKQLFDLLSIVRKDAGGSLEVANLIQQTKEDFEVAISSDMMKSRLKIVDQKSSDQTKINQRLASMLGSDVVINGARTREYHDMVREYVKYIVTITQKINSLAQFFNITLPVESEFPNGPHIPVMDEMPCTPVNAITSSKYASESLERANNKIEYLEAQLKQARSRNDDLQKDLIATREETNRLIGNSSYWIVKDQHGRILQKNNPDKPLETPADLNLHGTIDTALFFTTARSAEIMVERLTRSRRFRKYNLNSYRVSIVQQTFNERQDDDIIEDVE